MKNNVTRIEKLDFNILMKLVRIFIIEDKNENLYNYLNLLY